MNNNFDRKYIFLRTHHLHVDAALVLLLKDDVGRVLVQPDAESFQLLTNVRLSIGVADPDPLRSAFLDIRS